MRWRAGFDPALRAREPFVVMKGTTVTDRENDDFLDQDPVPEDASEEAIEEELRQYERETSGLEAKRYAESLERGEADGEEPEDDDDEGVQKAIDDASAPVPGVTISVDPTVSSEQKSSFSGREKVLLVVAVVAAVLAVVGFVLYARAVPPSDAAAKVDDSYIEEEDVAEWISQYRASSQLQDDDDFADALISNSYTVSTFRNYAISELAMNMLIEERAEELGITVSDDEIEEQLEAAKESYASGDDDEWADVLEDYGLTEDDLREQYKINLEQEAICEQDVETRDANDEELLYYIQYYLAGSTQKHAYRIVFTGDGKSDRAKECYEELEELQENGELDVDAFSEIAVAESDEEGVEDTLGNYAWSGSDMDDDVKEIIEYVDEGSISEIESIDGDDAVEIFYCDEEYTFDSASDMEEVPDDVPEELMAEVEEAAADFVYSDNCDSYLSYMLAQAEITYYPVPEDAEYNVDLSGNGETDEEEDSDDEEDSEEESDDDSDEDEESDEE